MLTFRVETPSWGYDPLTGWVSDIIWTDSGLTFPSPYSANQYAKGVLGRVVDEETDAEPAHGGVVSQACWELGEKLYHSVHVPVIIAMDAPVGRSC
jgi:hypothetical protein